MGSGSSSLKSMSAGKRVTPPAGQLVREQPRVSPTTPMNVPSGSKLLSKDSKKSKKVSKELLERWTSSINSLFADEDGIAEFREYLRKRMPEEERYINFYQECSQFKEEMSRLEEKANEIFEKYLSMTSELQVCPDVDEEVETKLDKFKEESPKDIFNTTQQKAKEKLDMILYPKFCQYLRNDKYKALLQ